MNAATTRPALVVMAKRPALGTVKTRLAAVLSAEQRLHLYTAFLHDKIDQVVSIEGARTTVAFSPAEAREEFAGWFGDRAALLAQRGDDLGQRLAHVFEDLLCHGAPAVVVVDSDTPNLPTASLTEALAALSSGCNAPDLVLGPAWDGGYYLIGMRRMHRALLEDIPWSTSCVLTRTLAAAERAGLRVHLLRSWYDVDTPADLQRLANHLADAAKHAPGFPARTAELLRTLAPATCSTKASTR